LMVSAKAQAQRGKMADAEKLLATVIANEPGNLDARFMVAMTNAAQGRTDVAVSQIESGRKLQPDDTRWSLALAALHSRRGEKVLARKTLEEAMAKSGEKPELLEKLATLQIELKDGTGALQTFENLLKKNATSFEYRLGRAGAQALAGDRQGALKLYADLQKTQPDDVRVWLQPAALLGEMGRTSEARLAYGEALRLNPNHPMVLNNLAWLLLERHEDEREALELAQRAKRSAGQSAEVDGTLAAAYSRLEMHRNATAVYEEMLSYLPSTDRPRIEKLLAGSRKKQRKEGNS